MKNTFKQLIIDFHQDKFPPLFSRAIPFPQLPTNVRKAHILIGMRRSGKTYVLYEHMRALMQQGIEKEQVLYINFEDDRLNGLQLQDLRYLVNAYFELYPQYIHQADVYFYLDEIQNISGWEQFIRRLLDKEKMSVYISGSSAKMLSKDIATALRGRAITREIFPFSFLEFLHYKDIQISTRISSTQQAVIQHHLQYYLQYGGFPESFELNATLHRELLQSYVDTVIYRDIIERHKISNVQVLKKLLTYALQNGAKLLSIHKLYNDFKAQGYSISKNSLYEFMGYIEDAYCIFSIPMYSFSARKSAVKPKKIYPIDPGLITAYTLKSDFEKSTVLETLVFLHLRRTAQDIYYYQTSAGNEIDFITVSPEGEINLYQVSLLLKDAKTKKREVLSLQHAMKELKLSKGIIVTLEEEEEIINADSHIHCMPLWKFLTTVFPVNSIVKYQNGSCG